MEFIVISANHTWINNGQSPNSLIPQTLISWVRFVNPINQRITQIITNKQHKSLHFRTTTLAGRSTACVALQISVHRLHLTSGCGKLTVTLFQFDYDPLENRKFIVRFSSMKFWCVVLPSEHKRLFINCASARLVTTDFIGYTCVKFPCVACQSDYDDIASR